MPRRRGRGPDTSLFVPILFVLICVVCCGVGIRILWHMARAQAALAGDAGCTRELQVTTPVSETGACRIVHGTILQAYDVRRSSRYGGSDDEHYVRFSPQAGASVDIDLGDGRDEVFDATPGRPNAPAAVEYVDGEIDYVASRYGTIGPMFDPVDDAGLGWFAIGLGAFFAIMSGFIAIVNARTREHRAATETRIARYLEGGRPARSPRSERLAREAESRRRSPG